MKRKDKKNEPTIAPGMDTEEQLNQDATQKDIQRGEYTEVTHLSLNEIPEDNQSS